MFSGSNILPYEKNGPFLRKSQSKIQWSDSINKVCQKNNILQMTRVKDEIKMPMEHEGIVYRDRKLSTKQATSVLPGVVAKVLHIYSLCYTML